MPLTKSDLSKNLAKKIDGRMKSAATPERFAKGSGATARRTAAEAAAPARLVAVSCRLPADLVNRLRERAAGLEGGVNAAVAEALEQWLSGKP